MIFDFKAFNILSADIYNKVYFRTEIRRRFKMSNRFNNTEIY